MPLQVKIENGKIFATLKNKWLTLKPEEVVRQRFIATLHDHYGYVLEHMEQELTVSNGYL